MSKHIKPIHPIDNEFIGVAEIAVKINLINADENTTLVYDHILNSTFDGLSWESELFWMISNFMIDQIGYEKVEILDAINQVTEQLNKGQ
tara:strand:- start:217 stop:486 length:270 start_codon:yes stop_codon:yes gene_type:complete